MSRATVMPKPILKQSTPAATPSPCNSVPKHPHFAANVTRYSGIEYDRTPIEVMDNDHALPERGCPGRTFDGGFDIHHYRHTGAKKCSKSPKTSSNADMQANYFTAVAASPGAASAAQPLPRHLTDCLLVADSAPMPSLSTLHGDTSESSDGDVSSPPTSDFDGVPAALLHGLMSRSADHAQRLRKAQPKDPQRASNVNGLGHSNRLHRTNVPPPPSPDSTFASCPGSNSCLGGF